MKTALKIFGGVIVLFVAVIAAGFAILSATDPNDVRDFLSAQVKQATGREFKIAGDLKLSVSLTPTVVAHEVSLANTSWGSRAQMVTLKRLETGLSLMPLLQGTIVVTRIVLIEPDILLETNAQGQGNWVFGAPAASGNETASGGEGGGPATLPILQRVMIENGKFRFIDGQNKQILDISLNRLGVSSAGPDQPMNLRLSGSYNKTPFALDGEVASLYQLGSDPEKFALTVNARALGTELSLKGAIQKPLSRRALDLMLNVSGADLNKTWGQAGKLVPGLPELNLPPLGPLNLAAKLSGTPEKLALSDLKMTLASTDKMNITASGSIKNLPASPAISLAVNVSGNDFTILSGLAGQALQQGPPYIVSASFQNTGNAYNVENLKVSLGKSKLTGSLSATLSGKVPKLKVTLTSPNFDLADVQAVLPVEQTPALPKKDDGRVFPDDPLPVEGLKSVDLGVRIFADKVGLSGLLLSNLTAGIDLKQGRLTVSPLQAELAGGKLAGDVVFDASRATPRLETKLKLTKFDIGKLLKDMEVTDVMEGAIDVDISSKGAGSSVRAIMANLNGSTELVMDEGKIASKYVDLLAADLVKALVPGGGSEDTKINCMVSRFDIKNGLAVSKGLLFDTAKMSVTGGGEIDLKTEKLNLQIKPEPKEASLVSLSVAVDIGGTLKSPSATPSTASVLKGVAGLALGAVNPIGLLAMTVSSGSGDKNPCIAALDTAAKGGSAKEAPTPQAPKKSSNPVEAVTEGIGGALKSLFGK